MVDIIYFEDVFGNFGGIEKMIVNILSNINLNKYRITIVVNKVLTNEYISSLDKYSIDIVELQDKYIDNPLKRHLKGVIAFSRFLNEREEKIIHFHISNAIDLLYVWIAKLKKIPNRIVHCHNSGATSKVKCIMHRMFKLFLCNTPTKYLACSDEAAKWLYSPSIYKNNKYILIKNAIDVREFDYDEKVRNSVRMANEISDKFVVGNIGRFNLQKNHKFLIDIFAKIKEKKENAVLLLVGEGSLRKNIEEYVQEKRLQDGVIFYGVTTNISSLMQAMDCFILPSLYEGLPVVLVEIQAAGVPALVSDTITRDVAISDYIHYMSLQNNADEWADKAISVSSMQRKNSHEIMKNTGFEIRDMVKVLEDIYDECVVFL